LQKQPGLLPVAINFSINACGIICFQRKLFHKETCSIFPAVLRFYRAVSSNQPRLWLEASRVTCQCTRGASCHGKVRRPAKRHWLWVADTVGVAWTNVHGRIPSELREWSEMHYTRPLNGDCTCRWATG